MPHGTPDWWGTGPKSTTYALQDLAELAVRLGSVNTYDRRGDVVWWDDWSGGAGRVIASGTGYGWEVYPVLVWGRYSSVALMLRTTQPVDYTTGFDLNLPYPVPGGIGVEVGFGAVANLWLWRVALVLFDGQRYHRFSAQYNHEEGVITVLLPTGNWLTVGSPGRQLTDYNSYCTLKLVISTLLDRHVRVLFNHQTYLLTDYSPQLGDDALPPHLTVEVRMRSSSDIPVSAPCSHVIVTQNEPV